MRRKTKQRLTLLAAGAMPLAGLSFATWAWTSGIDLDRTADSKVPKIDAIRKVEIPSALSSAEFRKRMQGPAKVVTPVRKQPALVPVAWPNIRLDCVFDGAVPLAVLVCDNQTYRCLQGDTVMGVRIDKIAAEHIVISLQGQTKTVKLIRKAK